jgi:hypothetical protein
MMRLPMKRDSFFRRWCHYFFVSKTDDEEKKKRKENTEAALSSSSSSRMKRATSRVFLCISLGVIGNGDTGVVAFSIHFFFSSSQSLGFEFERAAPKKVNSTRSTF